ncbi:aldehyde dehydrogenase family protein [Hansschlegelia quercus]|uniref:aldehyde dehydrogenase (NAD(+)) n=1 Tax=Hansschlegelia quercus TaxID=2528245 RepID=A0A4Q9GHK6_9HYPH|nr:aldehyde dehydrogenase family protein [Hansschlegelia quercus]TBN48628.1 aldehyde dehydrogenase family protein [Hansschlegelia quercus]
MTQPPPVVEVRALLEALGVPAERFTGGDLESRSPIDGALIGTVASNTRGDVAEAVEAAHDAFVAWRSIPAPRRGELVRLFGEELRRAKAELGRLVAIETGKIVSEGLGEVQEMIDVCDFAVGLSRQLYGLTIASERPEHRMMEIWRPLGVVGIISAFNFPVAVWAWNAALALVCGNAVVWKPSEKTPLTALAVQALFETAAARVPEAPRKLSQIIVGSAEIGEALVDNPLVPLVSATGSTAMGRAVGARLARRFARALLELGGNNAAIVCPTADIDLTLRAVAFSAMGTAGQRCTTLRRLFVHDAVYNELIPRLKVAYTNVAIGDPRHEATLIGPLIDGDAFQAMQEALDEARALGWPVHGGARVPGVAGGFYVRPALVEASAQSGPMIRETFAPILYVVRFSELDAAIELNNAVAQGLSSSIFTNDLREAELFLSERGSDCGIANVNIGSSGAEIGGAFGGEKETGGGRESGSDSWKAYMRRATNTVNYGRALPLAQGVKFDI